MSKVPEILRSKLLQVALGFAAGAATYVTVEQHQAPSPEVQLAMEIGAHYESSGRHIGKPYRDVIGKGQPWTVCNGVTGPEVDPAKYYTPERPHAPPPRHLLHHPVVHGKRLLHHAAADTNTRHQC